MITTYRSDITGLRAVAVLAVLIFHVFPSSLVGGYLGVDMFFVISGYLITLTLITEKQRTGSVSLIGFYKRRIFRIAPVTIFVIFSVLLFANLIMDFEDLVKTSKSAMFSTFGFANMYFYQSLDTSYFAKNTALNPLLHLWSLGVEEQFYFIFPLLFIFLSKYKRTFFVGLAILGVISAVWASVIVKTNPMFVYYMLPTRAFGLILGCLSALFCTNYYKNINRFVAVFIAIISVALIGLGFSLLSEKYNLPNYLSLSVVIPTALLIIIGYKNSTFIHKILGSILFKHIGLWSFSIYLIHWVILSCYKYINGLDVSITAGIIIFIASICLGGFSYYAIEQTLRFKRWNILLAVTIFIAIPFGISLGNYFWENNMNESVVANMPKFPSGESICYQGPNKNEKYDNLFRSECTVNSKNEPNIVLIGDSYGNQSIPLLEVIAKKIGFGFRNMNISGCAPYNLKNKDGNIVSYPKDMYSFQKTSNNLNPLVFKLVKNYDVVILARKWIVTPKEDIYYQFSGTLEHLSKTAKFILVLGAIPIMDTLDLKSIVQYSLFDKNKNNLDSNTNKDVFEKNKIIKEIVKKYPNVYYIDFNNLLCDDKKCKHKEGKNSLYYNPSHLSTYGANWLGEQYVKGEIDEVFYKIKALYKEKPKETFEKQIKQEGLLKKNNNENN